MKVSTDIFCDSAEAAEACRVQAVKFANSCEIPFVKDITTEGPKLTLTYREIGLDEEEPWGWLEERLIGYRDGWQKAHKTLIPGAVAWNEHTRWILGRPNFTLISMAQSLRLMGHEIPTKAEDEQAYCIWWLLSQYQQHGDNWREEATRYFKEGRAEFESASKTSLSDGQK